ncbi:YgcG family protein [Uliginosibacterium sp. sgz301328]|uniref:TPM domain-containing protein n=1 Tax=Uliginosibacterium sp. sgz301328 TaxID=3243764 RepID=UPI00359D0D6E
MSIVAGRGLAMPTALRWLLALCLCAASALSVAQDLAAVPPLSAHITDTTGTLSEPERAELEARLTAIEQQTGSQVAVLMVPTTQPEDIAAYGIRVADAWKVGRKNVDDGVILILAKNDRRLRIEVGRGLEGAIPDAIARRIIAEAIAPKLQRGDFHAGIAAGIERIAAQIGGEGLPPPSAQRGQGDGLSPLFWPLLIFVFFVVISILRGGRRSSYYSSRSNTMGGIATGAILDSIARNAGRGRGGWGGGGGFGGGGGWGGGGGGFGGGGSSGSW